MKQAYTHRPSYLPLITTYLVSIAVLSFGKLGIANANDLCGSDTGKCAIENRIVTVGSGDSYDTLTDNSGSRPLYVGDAGWGILKIDEGGKVKVGDNSLQIAYGADSSGVVKVSGQDAKLDVGGSLRIGKDDGANGTLIINKSGEVSVGQGTVSLAESKYSKGLIYIGAKSGETAV